MRKTKKIIVGVIIALIVVVGGYLLYRQNNKNIDKATGVSSSNQQTNNGSNSSNSAGNNPSGSSKNASSSGSSSSSSTTNTSDVKKAFIARMAFVPNNLIIRKGTTVTWKNTDRQEHTVTSDKNSPVSFDSKTLAFNQTFSFTFTKPGVYGYHCKIHPEMTAEIRVTD